MDYRDYFKGKRVTVMGLGLLGRGVGDAAFLAEYGTEVLVTDLKSEDELRSSLQKLVRYTNITYVLGKHRVEDFEDTDVVLKAAGVPQDSPYIEHARKKGIPIEMSTSLFMKLLPEGVMTIGVTGTRGKSTVTHLLHHMLTSAKLRVHLGGNVRGVSTLSLLPTIKPGDVVVLELDSWQLQGFGESKISPRIALFTNFLSDHMNYYRGDSDSYFNDKTNIFRFQRKGDHLLLGREVAKKVLAAYGKKFLQTVTVISPSLVPKGWKLKIPGEHNRYNTAFAAEAAGLLGISRGAIRKSAEYFRGVPGRLELIRTIRGIEIYNDTTATTPDATLAALQALRQGRGTRRRIILIAGGADKELNMGELLRAIPRACKAVVLLKGSGTGRIEKLIRVPKTLSDTLEDAIRKAIREAKRGDLILFSPAFASFGMFQNEFDRGEQFVTLVKQLR
jgi:UDP-N-acetylmuramoylalanine--D-glutamate ligase